MSAKDIQGYAHIKKGFGEMMKQLYYERSFILLINGILLLSLLILPAKGYALGVGDKSPDFSIVTIKGSEISYDRDIRGKKPVYLFFWTTW